MTGSGRAKTKQNKNR